MILPQFYKVNYPASNTINVVEHRRHYFINSFHYHPELEFTLITKSKGMRFLGDTIEPFSEGDLVLIGSNIPHCWRNDASSLTDTDHKAEMLTVQFCWDFIGNDFYKIPECIAIVDFLQTSKRGLQITGKTRDDISTILLSMNEQTGIHKIISLISALDILSRSTETFPLASIDYVNTYSDAGSSRINNVNIFLVDNFSKQISLSEVASVANMSETAFCRYLKLKTGKTYSQLLNEIRIRYACKLLITSGLTLSGIAYESGYNNLSNFIIQFKAIMKQTPKDYQAQYKIYSN